ncbi:hypothetical protein [Halomontanus rarus]|uniref:hypothetical protein n=1 Tax=Halomontanus rarus TaxID=3034020 RepID=UPI00307C6CDF
MTNKQLTEEDAKQFLELLDRVEADLEEAFSDASREVFGEGSECDFEEKWGTRPSTVYTEQTRGKIRRFVKHAYLGESGRGVDGSSLPEHSSLARAIEAEGTEQIECPFCGEEIMAFELSSDHSHSIEQLELIESILRESGDAPSGEFEGCFGAVEVPNEIHESADKECCEVPRSLLDEMQKWVEGVEFDNQDIGDFSRRREFGEFVVEREHFQGHEDRVSIRTENCLSLVNLSTFLQIHPDGDGGGRDDLVEQAGRVLSLVRATAYPVAHGEAHRLKEMLGDKVDDFD